MNHPPAYPALLSAVWNLASPDNPVVAPPLSAIYWTVFSGQCGGPAGIVVTVEGQPIPVWLLAHVTGTDVHLIHASIHDAVPGPVQRYRPGEHAEMRDGWSYEVVAQAVKNWLESGAREGRVEPETVD